jgi:hypothetical protein
MIEHIIIFIVFIVAVVYIGRLFYRAFSSSNTAGCAKGCGSCGAIDFNKIAQDLDKRQEAKLLEH